MNQRRWKQHYDKKRITWKGKIQCSILDSLFLSYLIRCKNKMKTQKIKQKNSLEHHFPQIIFPRNNVDQFCLVWANEKNIFLYVSFAAYTYERYGQIYGFFVSSL